MTGLWILVYQELNKTHPILLKEIRNPQPQFIWTKGSPNYLSALSMKNLVIQQQSFQHMPEPQDWCPQKFLLLLEGSQHHPKYHILLLSVIRWVIGIEIKCSICSSSIYTYSHFFFQLKLGKSDSMLDAGCFFDYLGSSIVKVSPWSLMCRSLICFRSILLWPRGPRYASSSAGLVFFKLEVKLSCLGTPTMECVHRKTLTASDELKSRSIIIC